MQESEESSYRTVQLKNAALSPSALKAVLAFMYTERLDIPIEEVDAVMLLARKCRLRAVEQAIAAEQRTLKYYFKSTRKHDEGPRRYGRPSLLLNRIYVVPQGKDKMYTWLRCVKGSESLIWELKDTLLPYSLLHIAVVLNASMHARLCFHPSQRDVFRRV